MLKTVNRQIFYHIQHGNQKISKSGDILDIGSTENYHKQMALDDLSHALAWGQKYVIFLLADNGNTVIISDGIDNSELMRVNVTGDNVETMILDVMSQGRQYLL